jgi:hypothetical protein
MESVELMKEALHNAQAAWEGCDWDTDFGRRRANLRGLRSRQARIAARATRGTESAYWREVDRFLDMVEKDAQQAGEIAAEAVTQWCQGDLSAALSRLDDAIALEALYREPLAYSRLRSLMRSSQAATSTRQPA